MNSSSELKKIIESINSSISTQDSTALYGLIARLKDQNATDPNAVSLLTMIQELVKYIAARGPKAHGDAQPLLVSLTEQFDQIVRNPEMEKERGNQIVIQEKKKFIALKNIIRSQPAPVIETKDLNDLKAVILALEWEISPDTVQKFEEATKNLLFKLQDYKLYYVLLKIILSTGNYIGAKKASANIDTIPFLRFSFDSFEQLAQNPGMAYQRKKEILDTCIHKFRELKQQIQLSPQHEHKMPSSVSTADDVDSAPDSGEEPLEPALSRFKSVPLGKTDKTGSLTPLPDHHHTDSAHPPGFDDDDSVPDQEGMDPEPEDRRDIMDDLFSGKESPADELLDAIHLLDINGGNQDKAQNILDSRSQSGSLTNFTPTKRDNEPIPEISTRLDELFNLTPETGNEETFSVPATDRTKKTEKNEKHSVITAPDVPTEGSEDSQSSGVIPFHNEDEWVDEENLKENDGLFDTLNTLHTIFKDRAWMKDQQSIDSIEEKISFLKTEWKDDRDKTSLLQIVTVLMDTTQNFDRNMDSQNDLSMMEPLPEKPMGIFGKIKNMFQKG